MQKVLLSILFSVLLSAACGPASHAQTLDFSPADASGWIVDRESPDKIRYQCFLPPRCADDVSLVSWTVMGALRSGHAKQQFKGLPAVISEDGSGPPYSKRMLIFAPTATGLLHSSSSRSLGEARKNFDAFAKAISVR
jgi:hypothetical protein